MYIVFKIFKVALNDKLKMRNRMSFAYETNIKTLMIRIHFINNVEHSISFKYEYVLASPPIANLIT